MEKIFEEVSQKIKQDLDDKKAGRINSIPVPFPRLSKRFPGWERGTYSIFTANSGVGKTKITKYLIITSILKFASQNPQLNVKIRWYALEETAEEFALSFVSTILVLKHELRLSTSQLRSLGEFTLEQNHLKKIDLAITYLKTFMQNVYIVDNIYNPFGIWKDVRQFAADNGKFYFTGNWKTAADEKTKSVINKEVHVGEMFTHYVPNNKKEFVFIVTDHIGLLSQEKKDNSQYETIGRYSKEFCLSLMRKVLNYHVINTQQQVAEKEKQEYTMRGKSIEEKLEPSLDGLANNKETQRDADLVIGFFAPTRYGIDNYKGYDIIKLKDRFRCLIFLKDRRYGVANNRVYCFFDGATNVMEELPKASEMTEEHYKMFAP